MLIGIEASAAVEQRRTGVGNYVANLIAHLQALDGDPELLLFSNRYGPESEASPAPVPPADIYPRDHFRSRQIWMQARLPRSIHRTQPDLCHFPNYLAPMAPFDAPLVITMHDMSIYRYPRHLPLKTVAIHRAMLPTLARRARLIVAVSESARQDIIQFLEVPPERVRVVYEGLGPHFQSPIDEGMTERVRRHYGLKEPYILTVCTLEPRKNHVRLIEAFTELVQQERLPHHLVAVGAQGWKDNLLWDRVRQCRLADRIHFPGYVPAADLPYLYRGASAFAFPSLYEGFGLPVLEALACGTPVLISHDPALMEVTAGAAIVVDPLSVDDIAGGVHRLIGDRSLALRLRERGFARAGEFSWDRCAAETVQLYREVLEEPSPALQLSLAK